MWPAIKKEILEGTRTYKFIIILAVFMFFALMNPVLNKMVLPEVLKSKPLGVDDETLSQMVISSQRDCVLSYLGDVFEIATLVIVLLLSSIVAGELRNGTFIFPKCSKKDFTKLVLAKLLVYGLLVIIVSVACSLIDYAYSGMLFGTDLPSTIPVIRSGLLQGLYFIYIIALVMFFGSVFKKPISAGLFTLIPAYGTVIISQLFNLDSFTPAGLLAESNLLFNEISIIIAQPIIITISLIVGLTLLTVLRLDKIELVGS